MPAKTFDASRHVDLLDLSKATDVVGKADASNAFQFLHLLVADDMRSLHRVVAQETVHDKDGNVRDNPARRSIFNDGNANTGYNNVQDVLDYLISKDTAAIHTVGNTRTLEALGSPGSTTQQKLDSLYSSTISPKDGDLVFVGLDMLTDTNKDAGIWHRFNNVWEHLVPAERYIDQRIKNNQAEIMQLEKAVTATLTYTPRELGNTRIIRIDLNTVDGFGKNYLLTDATPYEGIDVYLNGVRLIPENRRGDGDYLVEYATNTIRFQEQLPLQYVLQVDILIPPERVNPAYVRIHEIDLTEKGINPFNGTTTDFNLFSNLISKIATPKSLTRNEELMIYKGLGDRMKPGVDYTVDAAGLVKFTVAPAATDAIWALWYESRPRPVGGGGGGGGVTLPLDQSYAQYFGFDPVNGIPDWVDDRNHLQVVQTLAELNDRGLLPASHLQEGKLVFVKDDNRLYEFLPATAGARTDSMTDWRAINAAGPKVYNRVTDLPQPGGTTAVHDGDFAIVRYHNDGRTRLNTVFMARKYGTATLPRPSTTAAIKEDGTVLNITGLTPGSPNNYTMYVEVDPTISLAAGWPVTVVGRHKIYVQYSDGLVDEVEVLPGTYADWNTFQANGLVLGAVSPNPIAYHALDLGSDGHTYLSFENSAAGATFIHRVFKPVNTTTNPKPPVLPNRMIWIPTSTETYSNELKTDPDFTDAYPHDLQVTMENGHKVIKIWDNPNAQWVTVYDEDTVKQWIAAGNLFTGTAEETGHGTAGAIDVGNMPAETALGPTDKGHYWVWVGTSGHAIAAAEIGGVASAIDGQALSVGDWIQVSSPAAGKYQYSVIPGDLLSKATAQSLFGMNNWVKGAYQQGTVIVHQGDVYKATVAVLATDPAPNDPANTKWTKVPISGGVRSVASDGQLPSSAPVGSMYLVINSAQASSKPALYIYDLPTGQWQQIGGGGASQALDITGGTRINNIGVPIGTVITFVGTSIPKGWLRADGNTFDGRLYPQLQTMLGINRTPDLRGQFIRGATGNTLDNFVQHQYTTARPRHDFVTSTDGQHHHGNTFRSKADNWKGGNSSPGLNVGDNAGTTSQAGQHHHRVVGGGDPETAPDHVILFYLIKADDIGMFGGA